MLQLAGFHGTCPREFEASAEGYQTWSRRLSDTGEPTDGLRAEARQVPSTVDDGELVEGVAQLQPPGGKPVHRGPRGMVRARASDSLAIRITRAKRATPKPMGRVRPRRSSRVGETRARRGEGGGAGQVRMGNGWPAGRCVLPVRRFRASGTARWAGQRDAPVTPSGPAPEEWPARLARDRGS